MNVRNEPATFPPNPQLEGGKPVPLRPEEIQMYKECSTGLFYKVGIPFAVFCEAVIVPYFFKKSEAELVPQVILRRGFRFLGNMILGSFLATPICYRKLINMRLEYLKKNENLDLQGLPKVENTELESRIEDISLPISQVSDLSEPGSGFSSDYETSKFLLDDLEKVKTPRTTYQELRDRHRSDPTRNQPPTNYEKEPLGLGTYSTPPNKPIFDDSPPLPRPQKVVKRNKYGDEIE